MSPDELRAASKSALAEVHGQDPHRTYSVAEVKRIIYSLVDASDLLADAIEQAEAIDRMGPAAGCAYCVGAGGYEDYDGEWRECSCQQDNREPSGADFNRAAQTFYEASGLNLPHTSKPEVVAGVRAAWSALIAAQGVRDVS